jgi:hypothetical protein
MEAHRERPEADDEKAAVRAIARRALVGLPWDEP